MLCLKNFPSESYNYFFGTYIYVLLNQALIYHQLSLYPTEVSFQLSFLLGLNIEKYLQCPLGTILI